MQQPSHIRNFHDAPREMFHIARTGEALGQVAALGQNLSQFHLQHEILPPGHRSSSPHAHTRRDEVLIILAGQPDLWLDGHLHPLQPGDTVSFPAGTGLAHTVINNSTDEVQLLTIAANIDDDMVFYPLNPTIDYDKSFIQAWKERPLGPHDGRPTATT